MEANGANVIEGFQFGDTEDLSSLAGQTLAGVQVKAAGSDDAAIDAGDLELPAEGNVTAIAHLDAEGTPTLTVFGNYMAPVAAGQGRLVVRHTAGAPAVDVRENGEVAFADLTNPNEAQADLPAGTISADVVPAGATEPVVIGPADLPVAEGSSLIVYAVWLARRRHPPDAHRDHQRPRLGPGRREHRQQPRLRRQRLGPPLGPAEGSGMLATGTIVGRRALAARHA